jgi:hypothetical protein
MGNCAYAAFCLGGGLMAFDDAAAAIAFLRSAVVVVCTLMLMSHAIFNVFAPPSPGMSFWRL